MPYITREDGEHFVVPSYRDVLSAKSTSALKKDILQLSESYGEYITMQRKGTMQYEVAFSPDTGYLLGETVWHHFNRPMDMIYCEAIPNTTEAILVIVKSGSVYLDGSFPLDSISEELVIFLTQQNNFDIYIHGDVPISQTPEEGKFAFEEGSIKSFNVLDKPAFNALPLLKTYQLQLVEPVLKAHGIGVFPLKAVLLVIVLIGLGWVTWSYLTSESGTVLTTQKVSPYQIYLNELSTPAPSQQIQEITKQLQLLFAMPGWTPKTLDYVNGKLEVLVTSQGNKVDTLSAWVNENKATMDIKPTGIYVIMHVKSVKRMQPNKIYLLQDVLSKFIDDLATVYPGNNMQLSAVINKGVYSSTVITVTLKKVSPTVLALIGEQMKGLPFILKELTIKVENGSLTGTIKLEALGN